MEGPQLLVFLILIFWFFASPRTGLRSLPRQLELSEIIATEEYAFTLLNQSSYGVFDPSADRWINITGFRRDDNFTWDLLSEARFRAKEQRWRIFNTFPVSIQSLNDSYLGSGTGSSGNDSLTRMSVIESTDIIEPVYRNITGFLKGKWVRKDLAMQPRQPVLNLASLAPSTVYTAGEYQYNVTGPQGDLRFKLNEDYDEYSISPDGEATEVRAEMTLKDITSSGDGWTITLYGVHYPQHGTIVLTSTSLKYVCSMPRPSEETKNTTDMLESSLCLISRYGSEISYLPKNCLRRLSRERFGGRRSLATP